MTSPTPRPRRREHGHTSIVPGLRRSLVRGASVALAAFCLALPACKQDKPQPAPAADIQPVPAPAGLVADVFVPTPDATWQAMRTKLGGPMALLPATFPGALVTMLGLSPQLLEQIDTNVPSYGVMTDDGKRLTMVMGVHVRDGARVVTLMTEGADAKYTARVDASGVTLLEPKPSNTSRTAALGVAGNYLLSGETADDLVKGGPYVTRTLPTRPAEKGHIVLVAPRAALAGPLSARVRNGWASFRKEKEEEDKKLREQHGGKAPDFAEPSAALTDVDGKVNRVATLLADLELARVTIDFDETGAHARLAMTPAAGGGPASQEFGAMVTGDTAPLLAMPRSAVFGLLLRDSPPVRQQAAADQADSIAKLFGERIKEDDNKKIKDALGAWAAGRGDWLSAGLDATADGKTLVVRGALADQKQLVTAIESILALASVPAFKGPIEEHVGKLAVGKPAAADGLSVVRIKREQTVRDRSSGKERVDKSEFDVAWQAPDKAPDFTVAVSLDAKAWFKAQHDDEEQTVAARPDLSGYLQRLGNDVAFAVFLEPIRLMISLTSRPKAEPPAAPMLFAYGGNQSAAWFRLDLSDDATREVFKVVSRSK